MMEIVYRRCCGLDVHKDTVTACVSIRESGKGQKEIRTFRTMTSDLPVLHDWLTAYGITHVAMESMGMYWKPICNLLEGSFQVLLVNAAHISTVPGQKTDVKDCEWIADLLSHGLLKGGFIPPEPIRDLRDLTRYRKSLPAANAFGIRQHPAFLGGYGLAGGLRKGDVGGPSFGKGRP